MATRQAGKACREPRAAGSRDKSPRESERRQQGHKPEARATKVAEASASAEVKGKGGEGPRRRDHGKDAAARKGGERITRPGGPRPEARDMGASREREGETEGRGERGRRPQGWAVNRAPAGQCARSAAGIPHRPGSAMTRRPCVRGRPGIVRSDAVRTGEPAGALRMAAPVADPWTPQRPCGGIPQEGMTGPGDSAIDRVVRPM